MKRETFEQQLRDRLDGYEPQVPDNLWEEIDARLSSDTTTQEKHKLYPDATSAPAQKTKQTRVIPLWAKITAAAAVVVAAVLLIGRGPSEGQEDTSLAQQSVPNVHNDSHPVDRGSDDKLPDGNLSEERILSDRLPLTPSNLEGEQSHSSNLDSRPNVALTDSPSKLDGTGGSLPEPKTADPQTTTPQSTPHHLAQQVPPSVGGNTGDALADSPSKLEGTEGSLPEPKTAAPQTTIPQSTPHHLTQQESPFVRGNTGDVFTLSLFADNIFGHGGDASPMYMSPALADVYNYAFENAPEGYRAAQIYQLAGYADRSVHHRPVVAGVSAKIPLGGRWAVQTGLTYSWLSSEFYHDMHGVTITDKQSLQYLGIPLAVSYDIWNKGAFSLYAAAGGALHINTLSRLKTDGMKSHLSHDRLQWSMSAVVGAGYEFLPSFSLYVEPGVTWYPDNGSDIQNFFKDKPVNPSLQFGLRYRFSQR